MGQISAHQLKEKLAPSEIKGTNKKDIVIQIGAIVPILRSPLIQTGNNKPRCSYPSWMHSLYVSVV